MYRYLYYRCIDYSTNEKKNHNIYKNNFKHKITEISLFVVYCLKSSNRIFLGVYSNYIYNICVNYEHVLTGEVSCLGFDAILLTSVASTYTA